MIWRALAGWLTKGSYISSPGEADSKRGSEEQILGSFLRLHFSFDPIKTENSTLVSFVCSERNLEAEVTCELSVFLLDPKQTAVVFVLL